MRALWIALLTLVAPLTLAQYQRADRPRDWSFPADHGAHPEFATEWWYFTGSLQGDGGRRFGFELTFFRVALSREEFPDASPWRTRDLVLAHLAVTDVEGKRFRSAERSRRLVEGIARAATGELDLSAGDWTATQSDGDFLLRAGNDGLGLRLRLQPRRPILLQGEEGLSRKDPAGENASYYYSIPRLHTTGTLSLDGESFAVEGDGWMDHEFFSGQTPADGLGWDWFSFHMEDGDDLMIYRVRHPRHGEYVFASAMDADGRARSLDTAGASFVPMQHWRSPETGTRYPTRWEIRLPGEQLHLRCRALLDAQEIDARRSVGFAYWEGLSEIEGEWAGRPRRGSGYVELTGYDSVESR